MEMRKLSLRADLLGDKKVDYNLYGLFFIILFMYK